MLSISKYDHTKNGRRNLLYFVPDIFNWFYLLFDIARFPLNSAEKLPSRADTNMCLLAKIKLFI